MNEHRRSGTEVVDGLRGVAILVVLAYHFWLFSWFTPYLTVHGVDLHLDAVPRTGYLGVDLFFVISGFCLFYPVARSRFEAARPIGLRDYAYRRLIKIVPSYAIALAATAIVALPHFLSTRDLVWALANHLLFINNGIIDAFGKDNSVLWSLATEMQFYVLFPAIAWAFVRKPGIVAPALIGVALAFRFGLASHGITNESFTRQVPAFFDNFGFGMLAAYLVVFLRVRAPHVTQNRTLFTLASLALVACGYALMLQCNAVQYKDGGRDDWNLLGRTELSALTCAFIVTASYSLRGLRAAIANPALVFLSLISYNLYLWHTLVGIYMWQNRLPYSSMKDVHSDDVWKIWYLIVGLTLAIGISTAITYFIERPLLGSVKPQPFSFPWPRVLRSLGISVPRARSIGPAETNT